MIVPLTALGDCPIHLESIEEVGALALASEIAEFPTTIDVAVTLTRMGEDVLAAGTATTRTRQPCSRCLEPVETDIVGDFQTLYVPTTGSYGKRINRSNFEWSDQRVTFYSSDTIDRLRRDLEHSD